ncbi:hypothetical protein Bca4012_038230 [Brassica carinata]
MERSRLIPKGSFAQQIDAVLEDKQKGFVERVKGYPKLGSGAVGPDKKWMVGAAIGTMESDKERLEHLVKVGANIVG